MLPFLFCLLSWVKTGARWGSMQKKESHRPAQAGDGNSWFSNSWFKGLELQRAAVAAGNAATTTAGTLWTTVHGIKV
jgi:hypothetical protein